MKAYKTTLNSYDIEEVEIEKATEHFVFLPPRDGWRARREARVSVWCRYWDTQAEAEAHIIERATVAIEQADRVIEKATKALNKLGVTA